MPSSFLTVLKTLIPRESLEEAFEPYLPFEKWVSRKIPGWQWAAHLRYLVPFVLTCPRLIVCMPPGHAKSSMITEAYPAWRLEQDPTERVIIGAYNADLARKFSRKVRGYVGRKKIDPRAAAVGHWLMKEGKGEGGLKAVGVGQGIAGFRGKRIIIDDPIKNREEADSEVYRERVWNWFINDIYPRKIGEDNQIIIVMTRWHEDDLVGRILQSPIADEWKIINLPALAEDDDPLGREPGAPLWPEMHPLEELEEQKALDEWVFTCLFQGQPVPKDGGFFQRQWFPIIEAAPADEYHSYDGSTQRMKMVRYWDWGGSLGGDWTVGTLMGKRGRRYYILDVVYLRGLPDDVEETVLQTAIRDGQNVHIRWEEEPGSAGIRDTARWKAILHRFECEGVRHTGSKIVRLGAFKSQAKAGNIYLIRGPWNGPWLAQTERFPRHKHDDFPDSAGGAYDALEEIPTIEQTTIDIWDNGYEEDAG